MKCVPLGWFISISLHRQLTAHFLLTRLCCLLPAHLMERHLMAKDWSWSRGKGQGAVGGRGRVQAVPPLCVTEVMLYGRDSHRNGVSCSWRFAWENGHGEGWMKEKTKACTKQPVLMGAGQSCWRRLNQRKLLAQEPVGVWLGLFCRQRVLAAP